MNQSKPCSHEPPAGTNFLGGPVAGLCHRFILRLALFEPLLGLAACSVDWVQLAPTGTPPAKRWQHKSVYDAASNRMILFGGKIPPTDFASDVWVLQQANGRGFPAW